MFHKCVMRKDLFLRPRDGWLFKRFTLSLYLWSLWIGAYLHISAENCESKKAQLQKIKKSPFFDLFIYILTPPPAIHQPLLGRERQSHRGKPDSALHNKPRRTNLAWELHNTRQSFPPAAEVLRTQRCEPDLPRCRPPPWGVGTQHNRVWARKS